MLAIFWVGKHNKKRSTNGSNRIKKALGLPPPPPPTNQKKNTKDTSCFKCVCVPPSFFPIFHWFCLDRFPSCQQPLTDPHLSTSPRSASWEARKCFPQGISGQRPVVFRFRMWIPRMWFCCPSPNSKNDI